jgi:hypothetical protein
VNGTDNTVPSGALVVSLRRPILPRPIHVSFVLKIGDHTVALDAPPGVAVIAGWNPRKRHDQDMAYLFVQGT